MTLEQPTLPGRNLVWRSEAARSGDDAPFFAARFPIREVGIGWEGETLPCFGLYRGFEGRERARCDDAVVVHLHDPDARAFVVELATTDADRRCFLARFEAPPTLGAAVERARSAIAPSALGRIARWLSARKQRTGEFDSLKVPLLGPAAGISLADAWAGPAPETPLTLGRGEMYRRYFVCDAPFLVLVTRGDLTPAVAARIGDARPVVEPVPWNAGGAPSDAS